MEVVPDIVDHLNNMQEELEHVDYKDGPYIKLLKRTILPYSEIVYLYLLQNQTPVPPTWYQEDHENIVMLLMLIKHFPSFAQNLGELYTSRINRYLSILTEEAADKPRLIALLFEDLIAIK